jgi:hypothetical protein
MDTMTHGFEGVESEFEQAINNRGVTIGEHLTKMANLTELAKKGFRVIKAVRHDKYEVKGREQYYNPYTNEWYGTLPDCNP